MMTTATIGETNARSSTSSAAKLDNIASHLVATQFHNNFLSVAPLVAVLLVEAQMILLLPVLE